MVQDRGTEYFNLIFKCNMNGPVFLTDVLNTFLETHLTIMFDIRMWTDSSELWKNMCDIVRANLSNTQEAIGCDKKVLNSMQAYTCNCSDTISRDYNFCRKYKKLKQLGRDKSVL